MVCVLDSVRAAQAQVLATQTNTWCVVTFDMAAYSHNSVSIKVYVGVPENCCGNLTQCWESFCSRVLHFKEFCLPLKTICPSFENADSQVIIIIMSIFRLQKCWKLIVAIVFQVKERITWACLSWRSSFCITIWYPSAWQWLLRYRTFQA